MKIIKNRPFKATVNVVYPGDAADSENSFTGHFVVLDMETMKELKLGSIEGEDAYLDQMFVGWEGLVDSADSPFEVTPENRKALLGDLAVRRAIMDTYGAELMGMKRGN